MRPTNPSKRVARPLLLVVACTLVTGCGGQAAVTAIDANPAALIQEEVRPPVKSAAARPGAGKPVSIKP